MASLNTLRTRGGIIVSIVIGLALLAFLLTDLMTSGSTLMNANKTKVGEIDGNSIGYITYSNQLQKLTTVTQIMSGRDALSTEEQDQVNNLAWEAMIMQEAYLPGLKALGISTSEGEQIDMVSGVYLSPVISRIFLNQNTGQFDPALLKGFIDNIDADQTGRSALMWNYLKEQMVNERAMSKFIALVTNGMYVTDFEVEQGVIDADNSYSARYVTLPYMMIADSTIKVSNSEVKAFYNEHEKMFRQTASRDIEYVVFDLLPSETDRAEAEKQVNELAREFAVAENPMQFATLNSQEKTDTRYYKESELSGELALLAFGSGNQTMSGPTLEGDIYTMARGYDVRMLPDSLGAEHILLPATDAKQADSIVTALKAGADFATLAAEYSLDQGSSQRGGDLGVFAYDQMIPAFSEACAKASKGDVFTVTTNYGLHVVRLTHKTQPVRKAQFATIAYKVEPSAATQQEVYGKASKFIAEGSGSYDNFKKAALDNGMIKRVARIRNTERTVRGMDNSRELVRWAFNGQVGDVSQILDIDGNYVIAAITDAREDGIATVEEAAQGIRTILVRDKKSALLAEKLQGSSIDEIAAANGAETGTVDSLQFNAFYINGVGTEQALIGAICGGAKPETLSKPIDGVSGVYRVEVTGVANTSAITPQDEKVRLEAMSQAYIAERLSQAMVNVANVKDSRVRFF